MSQNTYRLERIGPHNVLDLIPLYKGVFGKTVTSEFLQAKYDTRYLGKAWYGHLAYDQKDRPVAYYGAVPFALEIEGKRVIAAQSGDAMTLPGHNGQGLFTRLGEATDRLLEAEQLAFVYGFPNQNSHYGYTKKLHWQHEELMQRYTIPVATLPLEAVSRALSFLRKPYELWVNRCLPKAPETELPNSVIEGTYGGTARDTAFFKYKFFLHSRLSRIGGKLVWLKAEGGLLIGDVEQCNSEEFSQFLKALRRKAFWLGIPKITFQVSPGAPLDHLLKSHYPAYDSWAIGYKDYGSGLPLHRLRFTYGDLDTF
ncbi:MAG: GNAT family N-acetyltransferase [Salibacteraceae bacterium]